MTLDELARAPAKAATLSNEKRAYLLTQALAVVGALAVPAFHDGTTIGQVRQPHPEQDHLLSPKEAAVLYGVKPRWLLDHADEIPGMRRLSRKVIRFSERALRRHLNGSKA